MSEVSKETVGKLKEVILKQADDQRQAALCNAQSKADEWLKAENEKLDKKCALLLAETKRNAETERSRKLKAAARKNSGEYLKIQSTMLDRAVKHLEEQLVQLRSQQDYLQILCGMASEAAKQLCADKITVRLCADDLPMSTELVSRMSQLAPKLSVTVDTNSAPILGGLIATDEGGRRRIPFDWHSMALDMSETLAERLFTAV